MDIADIIADIKYWRDTFIIGHRQVGQDSLGPPQCVAGDRQDM